GAGLARARRVRRRGRGRRSPGGDGRANRRRCGRGRRVPARHRGTVHPARTADAAAVKRTLRGVLGILLGGLLLWAASVACVLAAGAWPTIQDADAIIVLGAAQYNGRPSPV